MESPEPASPPPRPRSLRPAPASEPFEQRATGVWSTGERLTWLSGLVLMLSSLMGWYTSEQAGDGINTAVIGWHTGWLGKAVFFLGLAMLLLAGLREAGIQLPASLPASLFVIAIGALATIFVLIRVISIPDEFFFAGRGVGIFVALAAAVAAIVAGLLLAADELITGEAGFPPCRPLLKQTRFPRCGSAGHKPGSADEASFGEGRLGPAVATPREVASASNVAESAQHFPRNLLREKLFRGLDQLLGVEGLADEAADASGVGLGELALVDLAAEHQHRDRADPVLLLDAAEHLPAVHARHHHVEEDQVGRLLLERAQALLGVACLADDVALELEVGAHVLA